MVTVRYAHPSGRDNLTGHQAKSACSWEGGGGTACGSLPRRCRQQSTGVCVPWRIPQGLRFPATHPQGGENAVEFPSATFGPRAFPQQRLATTEFPHLFGFADNNSTAKNGACIFFCPGRLDSNPSLPGHFHRNVALQWKHCTGTFGSLDNFHRNCAHPSRNPRGLWFPCNTSTVFSHPCGNFVPVTHGPLP